MLLKATGIEKRYGGVRALKHVSFDLRAGEVHALMGENGAGKSTLIKVLTGAVQPDAGLVGWTARRSGTTARTVRGNWGSRPSISSRRSFPISPWRKTLRW